MLSTLPSILNRPPVPAVDGALGRVAPEPREPREARAGFAALLQQQADLRAAALRNIDLQAAAAGKPAQPMAAAAAGGARSAATATPAKATEPAPRNAQAADQASPARADDTSPASRSPERPGAAAGATDRAAQPAAAAPTDADAAAEQAAAADRTAATAGDQATLLASRSRLVARTQAGEANALARPRAGGGAGLATAVDRAVDSGAVNTDAAGSDAAGMLQPANAAGPDASQVPAWLQGQALVTGWRPAPAPLPVPVPAPLTAAAPLAPSAQANAPALPAGSAAAPAAAAGAASARRLTAATSSLARQPGPITDAAQLPAAATSRKTPATLPASTLPRSTLPTSTTPALPKGLPALTLDTQPAGLAVGVAAAQTARTGGVAIARTGATVAAAGPGTAPPTPMPSVTGTGTTTTDADTTTARKSATTVQNHRRDAGPDAALEQATAAGTATPFGADPAVDGGPSGLTLDTATAASATDGGPAVAPPTRPIAEASAAPGGHEGGGSRTPIGAASNAVRSRPAANEVGVAAATQLAAPGAADTTTATTAAAVVSPALTMALAGTALAGQPGEGATAPRLPGDSERNPGPASRLPPVADPSLPGAAALPAPRSQGPLDLRAQAEQLAANGAAARPHSAEDRSAPSATTTLPTAAAGLPATAAAQAAQAAQADLRASAAGVDTVPLIELGAASMAAAAAVSGSAAAPALSANAWATAAPRQAEATIAVPLDSPAFAPALGAQISLFTRDGVQTARLQLNPAEMGPITVQIALDGSAARVDFQADMASTRALIEASLPALAGALQEAGMTLAGGGVSQQPSSHQPPPQAEQPGRPRRGEERPTASAAQPLPTRVHTGSRGLVDLVA